MNNLKEFDREKNYKLFYNTILALSEGQGFYSRLLAQLDHTIGIDELKNELPEFKDSLDVIYFLES